MSDDKATQTGDPASSKAAGKPGFTRLGARGGAPGNIAPPERVFQDPAAVMPADVMAAAGLSTGAATPNGSLTSHDPASKIASNVASPLASEQASKRASDQKKKRDAARAARALSTGGAGPMVALSSFLGAPIDPDADLVNTGYRFPRYYRSAIRLLAIRLNVDQQTVAREIMQAGFTGNKPGGPLRRIAQHDLAELLKLSYETAGGAEDDDEIED